MRFAARFVALGILMSLTLIAAAQRHTAAHPAAKPVAQTPASRSRWSAEMTDFMGREKWVRNAG